MNESVFRKGDWVRVVGGGLDVQGNVHSAYDEDVRSGLDYESSVQIGVQPHGVELYDTEGKYYYWKNVDCNGRCVVYAHDADGAEIQVFPRINRDGWTHTERRLSEGIFKRYFNRSVGTGVATLAYDQAQLLDIMRLVKAWMVAGGYWHVIPYSVAMDTGRELGYRDMRYVKEVLVVYNECVKGGQANL